MTKMPYITTMSILLLCMLLSVVSCEAKEVTVIINNLRVDEKNLQFDFILKNNTDNAIWFCKDVDDKSNIDYEIKVDEKGEKIRIRFVSFIVPQDIFLEEPIWAKYSKLQPNNTYKGNIKIKVPISDLNPLKKKISSDDKQIIYADTLILEIGVYNLNLEEHKTACCRDDSNSKNVFVSCFWAEKNKEHIVETQVVNQRIPVVIQGDFGVRS